MSSIHGRNSRRRAVQSLGSFAFGLLAAPHTGRAQATPPAATAVSGAFPVTINHALGQTIIPARPERIVAATDFLDLDTLLTLGVEPVTFGKVDPTADLLPWQGSAKGIPTYDATTEIDLEAIAAANPDLVVTMRDTSTIGMKRSPPFPRRS